MEFGKSNWFVRDHKVLIKIGPLSAAPSQVNYWQRSSKQPFVSRSLNNVSEVGTFSRKKKAKKNSRFPNVTLVNAHLTMPPGGNVVLSPGVHFVNTNGRTPRNRFFYNTNKNFFPSKSHKDHLQSKILKDNFNWDEYGARNVIYENYR